MSEDKDNKGTLNVSKEDINAINSRLDGFEKTINGLSDVSGKLDQILSGSDSKDDKKNDKDNSKDDHKDETPKEKDKKNVLDDKSRKRLEELENWKSETDKQQKHNHLMDIAKATAKDKGISLDNSIESFLGEDEETTKNNIESIAKDISNIPTKTTSGGFDTSREVVKDGKSFMHNLMDHSFGPKK